MTDNYIGAPVNRVDGRTKVTGGAKYAADFTAPGLLHGFVVSSPIAKGKITSVDTLPALTIPGVVQVFTHENVAGLAWFDRSYKDQDSPENGSPFRPLQSAEIQFSMQPIALVVAVTVELARHAATLIKFEFETEEPVSGLQQHLRQAKEPKSYKVPLAKPRGNAEKAFAASPVKHEADYYHGSEHHNPMELHASTVIYDEDGKLTIYDKTQGVINSQQYIKKIFGLSAGEARVMSPFVGGAFGSGLRPQYQLYLAVLAALELKRPVKVMLTRQQMFSFGHRPATLQKITIGASSDGKLNAIMNDAYTETSSFEEYTENIVNWSGMLYDCANVTFNHQVVQQDVYTPLDMRAPGGVTGVYAIETAIDEAAWKAGKDPLELRVLNYAEGDQNDKLPFSSKELRECYRQGAEHFGWSKRNPETRATRRGNKLIGYGVATGAWEAQQMPCRAMARLGTDGKLVVGSATADIGTGTYVSMSQIAADVLGVPLENVAFKLGDSALPMAPLQGGSWTASSVGSAVQSVCNDLRTKLFSMARRLDGSPFKNATKEDVIFANGKICLKDDAAISYDFTEVMKRSGVNYVEEEATSLPNMLKQRKYSRYTHSAVFVEVEVDEDLGTISVSKVVSAVAAGRIINPKTARSQVLGGVVWGISMALHEDSVLDNRIARFVNHDLDKYHVAVNKDISDIDVIFVEEHDDVVNPLGVKGLGEIGIVGVAAAISNAVYHATGKRVRDLPIYPDKLL